MPEQLSLQDQLHVRLEEKLRRELGAAVLDALADPRVIEVMLNPDGRLWIDELGSGMRDTGTRISAAQAENLLGTIAATLGCVVTPERPILEGELALDGSRFCGLLPPVVLAPAFCIRKAAALVYAIDDYVRDGILDGLPAADVVSIERAPARGHAAVLRHAIRMRENILVVGGTQSGKTTLANGLLHELSTSVGSSQRVLTIEETRELRCTVANHVALRTTETIDMTRLVRTALRLRPDRIIVGEVRGAEALAMLKAWNTGHPGGIATVHANDARSGLIRLEQLVQEANVPPQPALIAEAVDLIVVILRTPTGRRITEVARVQGTSSSGYALDYVEPALSESSPQLHRHLVAV
ncbi:MAG: P-type conjugative transfer ATPase TrbB [Candidatus Tyrphobacter sp.]